MTLVLPRWENWPHVLRMQQFSADDLLAIIQHANSFVVPIHEETRLPRLSKRRRHRVRLLFYEGSTRTETTFSDAAKALGCKVEIVPKPGEFSSAVKGESTEAAISHYAYRQRALIIRHFEEGASERAANVIDTMVAHDVCKPLFVINAGDGKGQHPTHALVDMAMIARKRPEQFLQDLTILFPGDLAHSRVVNSLLYAFGKFSGKNIRVLFCCPDGLSPHQDLLLYLQRHNIQYEFLPASGFQDAIAAADVVYMTRIQRERDNIKIPQEVRAAYVFRKEYLGLLKPHAFVMHPLPINEDPDDPPSEIDKELMPLAYAGDPRCVWTQQSHSGIAVRAALFDLIFAGMDQGWRTGESV